MKIRAVVLVALLFGPRIGWGQPRDDTSLDEVLPAPTTDAQTSQQEGSTSTEPVEFGLGFGEEFELEARDRVISASRTVTTIQEVPAIVTVITAAEIEDRGFRTINEILQTIPGFEGDRSEGHDWMVEPFARGNPRTLLILVNGINVVDPLRNNLVLDRKIPLEIVERIEVTSGPGGVLWGSNALLGVVNITTKTGQDHSGVQLRVGGGHGPGEMAAVEVNASYGQELIEDLFLFANLNFYSSQGAELTPDSQKVVGVLPDPDPDGISYFIPQSVTTDPSRDYFGSVYLDLRGGPFTLDAFIQYEADYRQQGYGGAVLTTDLRSESLRQQVGAVNVENMGLDPLWVFSLGYQDRYLDNDFGLNATAYFVRWIVQEDPFGTYPPSELLPRGYFTIMKDQGNFRTGLNLDADLNLPYNNRLIFGGEVMGDIIGGVEQSFPADATSPTDTGMITDTVIEAGNRVIGAVYASDEWRASERVALNAGARLQLSNTYDPAILLSGAMVWNLFRDTFLKVNYGEGFRPPEFQSTNTNPEIPSGITWLPNPNLNVERSRAIDSEINTILLRDQGIIDQWFFRADYSFTIMEDVIRNIGGTFENSGVRYIHTVEAVSRLRFVGHHELSLSYYFVNAEDDTSGPLRNIANHIFNAHGRLQILQDMLHLSADLTWIGPREDANRRVVAGDDPSAIVMVFPSDVFIEKLDPVWLLRAGVRVENVLDRFHFGVFGYNCLDQEYSDPDFYFDRQVIIRPQPRPRWSVFATVEAEF
ncbi:MAG: TonB-dependent receptor [Bradymonadales bacterium]|nr:TonB-dependent receptor [Bradymonadales bacterium]